MRRLLAFSFSVLCCVSCSNNELTRDKAADILKKDFPRPYEFKLHRSIPEQAKLVVDSDLEEEGLITVEHVQKAADIGKPLIHFTDKAKPYLLQTSEEDRRSDIQNIKIADEEFGEVTGIKSEADGKMVTVEYTTHLINLTPFTSLMPRKITKTTTTNKVTFSLYDDGWRMDGK